MNMLQVPHYRAEPPPPSERRWPRHLGRLLVIVGVLSVVMVGWRNRDRLRWSAPPPPREAVWWEGLHVHAGGRDIPRLELTTAANAPANGYLETAYNAGFHIRLPISDAMPSETEIIFAVEDPHGLRQLREKLWYLLRKTGPTTSTLYRLNLGGVFPTIGRVLPTNLDKQHIRVADLTSQQPVTNGR